MVDGTGIDTSSVDDQSSLWRSYEFAERHYDANVQLFSVRMNLFLFIQSAMIAFAGGISQGAGADRLASRTAVAALGLALALGWQLVAISSYSWMKTWRAHMMKVGDELEIAYSVTLSSALFKREPRRRAYPPGSLSYLFEAFSWFVRPTFVICCLPTTFAIGWIYIGWLA